jgi:signal transduction histidine kinase
MVMAVEEDGNIHLLAAESGSDIDLTTDTGIYQGMFQDNALNVGWVQGAEDLSVLSQRTPLQKALYEAGVLSYVAVPLFIQEELVGSLNLESTQSKAFTPDHIAVATEVAASLAVAIRQARLYERAQQEIAERLQAEEALRRYTIELESRNAELDAYAHTVAHDLKNPLSSISGYAEALRQRESTLQDDLQDRFLGTIAQNAHKMANIIDELLLLASVREKDEIEMQPLEMERIVAEARGRLLQSIEEHQGELTMPDTWPVAMGYAPWVEAIWTNYISNALKYGGQPPCVELGADVESNGWIRFWVRDNGQGLSPEEQARLFMPFERLHKIRIGGHGLGLSIVQRIAKKLGGQVGVVSEGIPGEGSTFYFTLPGLPD